MNRKEHWWQDRYGDWSIPAIIGAFALVLIVCGIAIAGLTAYSQTQGCHARLDAYRLSGHYNFWANTCFADLPGGAVNTDNLRQDSKGYTLYTPDVGAPVPIQEGRTP
jgi:hypothetical protein